MSAVKEDGSGSAVDFFWLWGPGLGEGVFALSRLGVSYQLQRFKEAGLAQDQKQQRLSESDQPFVMLLQPGTPKCPTQGLQL